MPKEWTIDDLRGKSAREIQNLYRNARDRDDDAAKKIQSMIVDNGLLVEENGGLPFDHPDMIEIEEICAEPAAIAEAVQAAEAGLPPLAGMEYRIVAAMGGRYGGHYTTNHAGRRIADAMLDRGWTQAGQKPMPPGSVAKSATVFARKGRS